ncbi:MAG TPA: hypothetical protein VMU88_06225 [bacterium]|nr:hypothetical protein [bacterium]
MRKTLGIFLMKVALGLLLLWLGAGVTCVVGGALTRLTWGSPLALAFSLGFLIYFPVHFLLYKPVLSHVLAHELTHALAALAMGGKVTEIHATHSGGSAVTSKSHFFISMAPYVVPLYTLLALGLFAIAAPGFKVYLMGLVGFTYSFHWVLTVYSLSHHQPDLEEGGVVFSLIFIFTVNMIVLMLLFSLVWPDVLPLNGALSGTFHWCLRLAQALLQWTNPNPSHPEVGPA